VNYWKDWKRQNAATAPSQEPPWEKAMTRREALAEADPMLEEAIDLVVREGEASASLIQRKLGIDYPRAAHLMDLLAELAVIGRFKEGGRSREVLLKPGSDPYKKLMTRYKK
jgi:S-DNA-T family DNA segregation ATPase FtsK/SpoIIIE